MSDLISRMLSAFVAGLLTLAYPGVSVEALTAPQKESEGEGLGGVIPS